MKALLDRPGRVFFLLSTLFYWPLLAGYSLLPFDILALTSLWRDPGIQPQNIDLFDALIYTYPVEEYLRQNLHQGILPFWNPNNLAGHPLAFSGQSGYFYLPQWVLLLLFSTPVAHGVSLWLHSWLAGYSSFRLARALGMGTVAAWLFGLAWMFNGYLAVWLCLGLLPRLAAWTPVVVLAGRAAMERTSAIPGFALSLGCLLLSGHLQFLLNFLSWGFLVGLTLVKRWTREGAFRLGAGILLGSALAAPCLLPTLVLMGDSQRQGLGSQFLLGSYRQFLSSAYETLLWPDLYGNPANGFCFSRIEGAGNFVFGETCLMLGVIPWMFALVGLWTRPGRPFALGALLVLVLPATPLYPALAALFGLDRLTPIRWIGLVHLLLLVASAHGFDQWARGQVSRQKCWLCLAWLLTSLVVAGIRLQGILTLGWQARPVRLPSRAQFQDPEGYLSALSSGMSDCYSWANAAFIAPLICVLVLAWVLSRPSPARMAPLLVLLTGVELFGFALRYNAWTRPPDQVLPSNPLLERLAELPPGERVAGSVKPNLLLPLGIRTVGGTESFYPRHSAVYFRSLLGGRPEQPLPTQVHSQPAMPDNLLDLLAVRHLVGPEGVRPRNQARPRAWLAESAEVVSSQEQTMERLLQGLRPGLVLVPEPLAASPGPLEESDLVEIVSEQANTVRLRAHCGTTKILVLSEAWCQGWQVRVDGQRAPLLRVNQMFRGVLLEGGDHQVDFLYRPPLWGLSLWLWGIALALSLVLLKPGLGK